MNFPDVYVVQPIPAPLIPSRDLDNPPANATEINVNRDITLLQQYLVGEYGNSTETSLNDIIQEINYKYSSANELLNSESERASTIAAFLFLRDVLTSDRFQQLRNNIPFQNVEDVDAFVAASILKFDFDRSFNSLGFFNQEGKIVIIPMTENQYYFSNLQVLLVQRLFEEGKKQVLTKYANDPNIYRNGELTAVGRLLVVLIPLSYTNVSRLEQTEIPVFNTFGHTPDYSTQIENLLNEMTITNDQRTFIDQELKTQPEYSYLPNYNTLFPDDPIFQYLSDLINGKRSDFPRDILAISSTQTGGIDVYFRGNPNNVREEIASGNFKTLTPGQFYGRLTNLFPMTDELRFLITRRQSLFLAESGQDEFFTSALPLIQTPTSRFVYEINNYNQDKLLNMLKIITSDKDFESSLPIFQILSIFDLSTDTTSLEAALENINDMRGIFLLNSQDMYQLAGKDYIPFQIDKFRQWLTHLVNGNLAILNPTPEQLSEYINTISVIFTNDNRVFFRIREYHPSLQIGMVYTYEVNKDGFNETYLNPVPSGEEYMIILNR